MLQMLYTQASDIKFNPQTLRSYSFPEIDIKSDNMLFDEAVPGSPQQTPVCPLELRERVKRDGINGII
jgi:hypothetical protein